MKKSIFIAFSGGCFSGKTTAMDALAEDLSKHFKVTKLSELARSNSRAINIDELRKDPNAYFEFEYDIINRKMSAERHALRNGIFNEVVLCDRAITDSLFYLLFYTDVTRLNQMGKAMYSALYTKLDHYADWAMHSLYDIVFEFKPLRQPCVGDDTNFRPEHIDIMKDIEYRHIHVLNNAYMASDCNATRIYADMNEAKNPIDYMRHLMLQYDRLSDSHNE